MTNASIVMRTLLITDVERLETLSARWNQLAVASPFASASWLLTWWRSFARRDRDELAVLAVCDDSSTTNENDDQLVAIAPFYLERSATEGRVLRLLGSGEVCSDYVSILCEESTQAAAIDAIADWLIHEGADRWDAIALEAITPDDVAIQQLVSQLNTSGRPVRSQDSHRTWRVQLPATWDEYLARHSKSHRKQVRRMVRRYFDSGRARFINPQTDDQRQAAFAILRDLHQQRRLTKRDGGCFGSDRFERFLTEVVEVLGQRNSQQLSWLELDGKPVAIDMNVVAEGVIYAYQSGIDPAALDKQPGNLLTTATIRDAIERGITTYDFLRGDEPYKAHWRGEPITMIDTRVVNRHAAARVRHQVWKSRTRARQFARDVYRQLETWQRRAASFFVRAPSVR